MIPPEVARRADDDPGFAVVDLDAEHDCMLTAPELVVAQLVAVAEAA
jgi:hypothetical protein